MADQRGTGYILNHPDLVAVTDDIDAKRRLFEPRTAWPGTRHACLAIVNTLAGDIEEAHRNAREAREWIAHHVQRERGNGRRRAGPGYLDLAAIPLVLVADGQIDDAVRSARPRHDGHSFEVYTLVLDYLRVGASHWCRTFVVHDAACGQSLADWSSCSRAVVQ